MKDLTIGMHVLAQDASGLIDGVLAADRAGIETAWLTSGGPAPDPLAVFAAAAGEAEQIGFGTSILPTFPRHPLAMVQGAVVVEQLAPGRLKLGIGPSHKPAVESTYRFEFVRPLQHLREYLTILNAILKEGAVEFHGERLHAEAKLQAPTGGKGDGVRAAPERLSALQANSATARSRGSVRCPTSSVSPYPRWTRARPKQGEHGPRW